MTLISVWACIFGAIIGSFLNVCIYRIPITYRYEEDGEDDEELTPRTDITISYPKRSFCPRCQATLRWYHNIPILSWIFLGGKCGYCREPIRFHYPLVELLSACAAWGSVVVYGPTLTAALIFVFCAALIVISFIDLDFFIIPDVISLPGMTAAFLLAIINQFFPLFSYPVVPSALQSLYGFLAGAGFLWVVSEGYFRLRGKEGLGLGDVKLLGVVGALFGPQCALFTIFVGSLLGCLIGASLLLLSRKGLSQAIPFGPYLAAATVCFLFTDTLLLDLFYGFILGM